MTTTIGNQSGLESFQIWEKIREFLISGEAYREARRLIPLPLMTPSKKKGVVDNAQGH